jgi:hypothetical protein
MGVAGGVAGIESYIEGLRMPVRERNLRPASPLARGLTGPAGVSTLLVVGHPWGLL